MKKKQQKKRTLIGGQAVIEGVMMRGSSSMATAVRDADGVIRIESKRLKPVSDRSKAWKIPVLRGFLSFVSSFVSGMKTLMRSAEVFGEGEPTKFEKWLSEKTKIDVMSIVSGIGLILGIVLAVGLFIWLPQLIRQGIEQLFSVSFSPFPKNLIEGAFKLIIFISYVLLIGLMKDIKRTFMYHGAEHKTIACYESGMSLTVENAKTCSRQHDRCGTTFIFLVIMVSIISFAVIESVLSVIGMSKETVKLYDLYRVLIKIAILPLVSGISYEILRGLAKTKSKFFLIFKAPGLAIQKITTREPDDSMLEVAITAFETVQVMDNDPSVPERQFTVAKKCKDLLEEVSSDFKDSGIDVSDAEWIVSLKTGIKRSEVASSETLIKPKVVEEIEQTAKQRLTGRPLWYIIGDTDFYGCIVKVDERVLIPRPETENLVEVALKHIKDGDRVLDLCTGSGAIAIALKTKKPNIEIIATDISDKAIELAKENATLNGAEICFVTGDLFDKVTGKYDIIITNPPYIKSSDLTELQKEVIGFEPILALDGGPDGLSFYRRINKSVRNYLNENGMLFMEVGFDEADKVAEIFSDFSDISVIKDLEGIDRIVVVKL